MATQPPHRRIGIRRATAADVDAITQIFFDAFSRSVMTRLMHPKGPSADARAKFAASLFPAEGDADGPAAKSEPGETIIMVAELLPGGADGGGDDGDDEQGEIVAFAKWWIAREPRSEAEWNVDEPMTAETVGEGVELDVKQRFIGGIHEMRRRWVRGDPAVVLTLLASAPGRGRLGAGTALLRWGLELADREGLNTWLESTPAGYPIYRRCGFEDMEVQDLPISDLYKVVNSDGEDWGAQCAVGLVGPAPEGVHRCIMMKRAPVKP